MVGFAVLPMCRLLLSAKPDEKKKTAGKYKNNLEKVVNEKANSRARPG